MESVPYATLPPLTPRTPSTPRSPHAVRSSQSIRTPRFSRGLYLSPSHHESTHESHTLAQTTTNRIDTPRDASKSAADRRENRSSRKDKAFLAMSDTNSNSHTQERNMTDTNQSTNSPPNTPSLLLCLSQLQQNDTLESTQTSFDAHRSHNGNRPHTKHRHTSTLHSTITSPKYSNPVTLSHRDISFLSDVRPSTMSVRLRPMQQDTDVSADHQSMASLHGELCPPSLVPQDLHIISVHAALPQIPTPQHIQDLEYKDHQWSLKEFPSSNPSSRMEAVQLWHLLKACRERIQQSGLLLSSSPADKPATADAEDQLVIPALVDVIHHEQQVYDLCLHELTRQIMIQCQERGSVLMEIRRLYADLFHVIPKKMLKFNDQLIAQKALSQRLSDEVILMKSLFDQVQRDYSLLKSEFVVIKKESLELKDYLARMKEEQSETTTLMSEYHELNRMQRARLEKELARMYAEKHQYSEAASLLSNIKDSASEEVALLQDKGVIYRKIAQEFSRYVSNSFSDAIIVLRNTQDEIHVVCDEFMLKMSQDDIPSSSEMSTVLADVTIIRDKIFSKIELQDPRGIDISEFNSKLVEWTKFTCRLLKRYSSDAVRLTVGDMNRLQSNFDRWIASSSKLVGRINHFPTQLSMSKELLKIQQAIQRWISMMATQDEVDDGLEDEIILMQRQFEAWIERFSPNNAFFSNANGWTKMSNQNQIKLKDEFESWLIIIDKVGQMIQEINKTRSFAFIRKVMTGMDGWRGRANTVLNQFIQDKDIEFSQLYEAVEGYLIKLIVPNDDEGPPSVEIFRKISQKLEEWNECTLKHADQDDTHDHSTNERLLLAYQAWMNCIYHIMEKRSGGMIFTDSGDNELLADLPFTLTTSVEVQTDDIGTFVSTVALKKLEFDLIQSGCPEPLVTKLYGSLTGTQDPEAFVQNLENLILSQDRMNIDYTSLVTRDATDKLISDLEAKVKNLEEQLRQYELIHLAPITTQSSADKDTELKGISRLRKFVTSKISRTEVRPKGWLIRFIRDLYELKFQSEPPMDVKHLQNPLPRMPLPDFVHDYYNTKYGLKNLIDQQIEDLIATVNRHKNADAEISTFALFLDEVSSVEELGFYLYARNVAYNGTHIGNTYPTERNSMYQEYLDLPRALDVCRILSQYLSLDTEKANQFSRAMESISITVDTLKSKIYATIVKPNTPQNALKDPSSPLNRRVPLTEVLAMFMSFIHDLQKRNAGKLAELFQSADTKKAGSINDSAFSKIVSKMYPRLDEAQILSVFTDTVSTSAESSAKRGQMSVADFAKAVQKLEIVNTEQEVDGITGPSIPMSKEEAEQLHAVLQNRWMVFHPHLNDYLDAVFKSTDPRDRLNVRKLRELRSQFEKTMQRDYRVADNVIKSAMVYRDILDSMRSHQSNTAKRSNGMNISSLDGELGALERALVWGMKTFTQDEPRKQDVDARALVHSEHQERISLTPRTGTLYSVEPLVDPRQSDSQPSSRKGPRPTVWYPDDLPMGRIVQIETQRPESRDISPQRKSSESSNVDASAA